MPCCSFIYTTRPTLLMSETSGHRFLFDLVPIWRSSTSRWCITSIIYQGMKFSVGYTWSRDICLETHLGKFNNHNWFCECVFLLMYYKQANNWGRNLPQFGTRPRHHARVGSQALAPGAKLWSISIRQPSFRSKQLWHASYTVFEAELVLLLIDVTSFKSTRSFLECVSPCIREDVTMVDE